jgi:two-component system, NarL family, sensor histidine kinase DesK
LGRATLVSLGASALSGLCHSEDVTMRISGWNNRAGMHTIDHATRWPLYVFYAAEPMIGLLVVLGEPDIAPVAGAALIVFLLAHCAACLVLLHRGIAHYLGGPRPSSRLTLLTTGLTLLGLATTLVVVPGVVDGGGGEGATIGTPAGTIALVLCAAFVGALASFVDARSLALLVAVPTAGLFLLQSGLDGQPRFVWALNYAFCVGFQVFICRGSTWLLGVVARMDSTREVQARLAVAEERLRFARDLHDVLGRNLALIAVNSELAAELVRRGEEGALERMLDVRRTAEDSMREVREVVGGYRSSDLGSELTGARSVLRSAGIRARVIGDGRLLPTEAQAALGWVVREATTNIIRHSDPSEALIELDIVDGPGGREAVLSVENDGVRVPVPRASGGNGLVGLRERLVALGGDLSAGAAGPGRFRVQARLTLVEPPPSPVVDAVGLR